MIRLQLLLVVALATTIAIYGVASVEAAGTPTPLPSAASQPASSPLPVTTQRPGTVVPVVNGVSCDSGTLVNGFLVVQSDEPPPRCQRPFLATARPTLYGLPPSPAYTLRFAGPAAGTSSPDDVYAEYVSTTGPNAGTPGAITISARSAYEAPPLIQVVNASAVVAVGYLPTPGIARPNLELPTAEWLDGGVWYTIAVDPRLTDLTLQEVARVLVPIESLHAPQPPSVGSGIARHPSPGKRVPLDLGSALLMSSFLAGLGWHWRKRHMPTPLLPASGPS